MNALHFAYNLIGTAGLALAPLVWLHQRRHAEDLERFHQRLGRYPQSLQGRFRGRPRIWLHAVSVGEVGVAGAIVRALAGHLTDDQIVLSTSTRQGLARARAQLQGVTSFYAPIDLIGPSEKALQMVQPDVLALLETEIWPNLVIRAKRRGVRTAILNGRISVRTIRRYTMIRPLMRHALAHIDAFSMISTQDALRIQSLGADPRSIVVNGNAKFDGADPLAQGNRAKQWALSLYGLQANTPVFVAGSTRNAEEPIVLDAFLRIVRDFPRTVLILAPRHTTRVEQIEQWIKAKGLQWQRRTTFDGVNHHRTASVVVLDTIGELSDTYSAADFVFCGGSLVPKGGQNLLEPAIWAKPVMYGPSMDDFSDARQLIERAGGGVTVFNADQMAATACDWLRHPRIAVQAGAAARNAILAHRGAAHNHAHVIMRFLDHSMTLS